MKCSLSDSPTVELSNVCTELHGAQIFAPINFDETFVTLLFFSFPVCQAGTYVDATDNVCVLC